MTMLNVMDEHLHDPMLLTRIHMTYSERSRLNAVVSYLIESGVAQQGREFPPSILYQVLIDELEDH